MTESTMVSQIPVGDFPFSCLPLEIRRYIWKLCLPQNRVIELECPNPIEQDTFCCLSSTSKHQRAPPVISRVCHEARLVAIEECVTVNQFLWIYPARGDILHMCRDKKLLAESWLGRYDTPLPLSITPGFIFDFPYGFGSKPFGDSSVWEWEDMERFEEQESWPIVLFTINLHVSSEQAISSGLFGDSAWLESRITLVDARDELTLERFDQLWRDGPREDWGPALFFEEALTWINLDEWNGIDYKTSLDRWTHGLTRMWVRGKYDVRLKESSIWDEEGWFIGYEFDKDNKIWSGQTAHEDSYRFQEYDADHEWVQGVLRDMPEFKPMIMFRLCEEKCYLPTSVPENDTTSLEKRQEILRAGPWWGECEDSMTELSEDVED